LQERLEHGLAEILLPDDRDPHAAFFGGTLNAPALFHAFIFSLGYPSTSCRISSVCSPSVGERLIAAGDAESLIGMPTFHHLPRCGWSSSTHMSRPRTCSSVARSAVLMIGPQGTSSGFRIAINSRLVYFSANLLISVHIRFWFLRRSPMVASCGLVAMSGMPTSGPMRFARSPHTASCTTT